MMSLPMHSLEHGRCGINTERAVAIRSCVHGPIRPRATSAPTVARKIGSQIERLAAWVSLCH
jgi:hypothetical protein